MSDFADWSGPLISVGEASSSVEAVATRWELEVVCSSPTANKKLNQHAVWPETTHFYYTVLYSNE